MESKKGGKSMHQSGQARINARPSKWGLGWALCTRTEMIPTPNDPQNRPKHDPKWSPTPNDHQIFSQATRNDPQGIIGMEWDDV